eukprot:8499032-Alexandrium_andersonii.AAC.1
MYKRLLNLDVSSNVLRHIAAPFARDFADAVEVALQSEAKHSGHVPRRASLKEKYIKEREEALPRDRLA